MAKGRETHNDKVDHLAKRVLGIGREVGRDEGPGTRRDDSLGHNGMRSRTHCWQDVYSVGGRTRGVRWKGSGEEKEMERDLPEGFDFIAPPH